MSRPLALALSAVLGCAGALATAQTAPPALVAELSDYIEMPVPPPAMADSRLRAQCPIEEPGRARFFVAEHGRTALHRGQEHSEGPYLHQLQRIPPTLRGSFQVRPHRRVCQWAHGFRLRSGLPAQRRVLHPPPGNPALTVDGKPKAGVLPGLDASRFVATKPIDMPAMATLTREGVVIEWTDSNIRNTTFEGTVREVMRVQLLNAIHPMSDLTFNPAARQGDADWRVLYLSTGDGGTGERNDVSRPIRSASIISAARSSGSCPTCGHTFRPALSVRTVSTVSRTTTPLSHSRRAQGDLRAWHAQPSSHCAGMWAPGRGVKRASWRL